MLLLTNVYAICVSALEFLLNRPLPSNNNFNTNFNDRPFFGASGGESRPPPYRPQALATTPRPYPAEIYRPGVFDDRPPYRPPPPDFHNDDDNRPSGPAQLNYRGTFPTHTYTTHARRLFKLYAHTT
jgi:hypothetical protein